MRLLVHDYSGHPFQVQLSRAMAGRGHRVLHVHCSSYETGKGAVSRRAGDPPTFDVEAIDIGRPIGRRSALHRVTEELAYGRAFGAVAARYRPDVVLSSNDPLFAKARAARWCARNSTPWVFWLQDIYSSAMAAYTVSRLGRAGRLLGRSFELLEAGLARRATSVVAITEDFLPVLEAWRIPPERCAVIENWAPLDDLVAVDKDNDWSRRHGLHDRPVLLYSGTLGRKHDPVLLVHLAQRVAPLGATVVVVSGGSGIDWLARAAGNLGLDNLIVLPYQPYEELPEVMGSADVLIVILERDAGVFSVPSKILSYLCAARPILAAMPPENLGATTILRAGAGVVVDTGDGAAFLAGAERLLADERLRHHHGSRARAYAEAAFDIEAIAERFEPILRAAVDGFKLTGRR